MNWSRIERLREFEAEGAIGELSDPAFSFMGGIYSARKVRDELAPKIAEELRAANVEAFYRCPPDPCAISPLD